ncbi:MAG: porin, partial [Roseiarcus sp.]
MTLAWRIVCGLPAGAATVAAAQAADLPTLKAAPIAYVQTCNVGGMAGFVIPGTETCLKISGYVNLEVAVGNVERQSGLAFTGVPGASPVTSQEIASAKSMDTLGFLARGQVDFDVRQQTSYGVLRGYAEIQGINSNGFESTANGMIVNVAYVQWAGLTAGKVGSFFSYLAGGPSWYDVYSPDRVSSNQPDVLAYTATFGGGFSATISFEDGTSADVNNGFNGGFNNTYLGERYPDVVAAVRADETWGSAQLSGVAHNTRAIGVSGDTADIWGYAFLAGAT